MICHVVLIRLQEGTPEQKASELLARARDLLGAIPTVRNLRIGRGLGKKAEVDYPYALVMEFENEEGLDAYQVHENHQRFVREVVDPIQEDKRVFDYKC